MLRVRFFADYDCIMGLFSQTFINSYVIGILLIKTTDKQQQKDDGAS